MWDDTVWKSNRLYSSVCVTVGKGNRLYSAVHVSEIPGNHHISHNETSFWIDCCVFGIEITIFKETKEGKKLQEMIKKGEKLKNIQDWIDCLILSKINAKKLMQLINRANKEAFDEGKKRKAEELREVLEY